MKSVLASMLLILVLVAQQALAASVPDAIFKLMDETIGHKPIPGAPVDLPKMP